uniref:Uncharacterized protein n=1 Tax=Tetraselmis sp. GSL018 TaxID=582737 RepID=A0A061RYS3_9CHLO
MSGTSISYVCTFAVAVLLALATVVLILKAVWKTPLELDENFLHVDTVVSVEKQDVQTGVEDNANKKTVQEGGAEQEFGALPEKVAHEGCKLSLSEPGALIVVVEQRACRNAGT